MRTPTDRHPADRRRARLRGLPACLAILLGAPVSGAGAQDRAGASPVPHTLTIEAMDYAFRAPASVPAGVTTIRLVNRGTQLHHVQLNRLEDGRSVQDMLREWKPGVRNPAYMSGEGGPTAALGGQTLEGQVVLRPGRYALICWVPAPDGRLHVHKGMFGQIEVVGAEPDVPPTLPPADVTVTMLDYGYVLPTLRPGRRVIRVFNAGPQAHELVMVRLHPGRTAHDAAAWAERGQTGESPGAMVGGVAALTPGRVAQFAVDVTPGEYALICFVPDQRDRRGRPHVAHGMVRQLTVR